MTWRWLMLVTRCHMSARAVAVLCELWCAAAQLTWFNHLLKTLWPHASRTIVKEVMAQAKPALIDVCNQARRCAAA